MLIEFEKMPQDINVFKTLVDSYLQKQNSYYKDLIKGSVLKQLEVIKIKESGFNEYMSSIGKLGGQNKTPRLSNDRSIADKLILYKK